MNRTRIVGGTVTTVDNWPFMVRLFEDQNDDLGFCGGVLITPSRVLTAAHCLDLEPGQVGVFLTEIGQQNTFHPCADRKTVISSIKHPSYVNVELGNDIAILEIEPVTCSAYTPVAIDDGSVWNDDRFFMTPFAYIAGWGSIQSSGIGYSNTLREARVYLYSDEQCDAMHASTMPDTAGCAGHIYAEVIDACFGDSGGPLIVVRNGTPLLVGIVSYGYQTCALPALPGIYTRVSMGSILSFITTNTLFTANIVDTIAYPEPDDPCECVTDNESCMSRGVDVSDRCGCDAHFYPDDNEVFCYVRDPFYCTSIYVETSFYLGGLGWKVCGTPHDIQPSSATRVSPHNYIVAPILCSLVLIASRWK